MKFKATSMALMCMALVPTQSLAWGFKGHQIVAALAWQYLTPKAQTGILNLLQLDDDKLTAPDFVSRAPWADIYRNSHKDTGNWHFVDIPLKDSDSLQHAEAGATPLCPYPTLSGSAAIGAPANDCVIDKIQQFQTELKNPATSTAERILALKFLIHFVGDIHQPLHASDDDDKGGNCVWITDGGKTTRLHSWWDTDVVKALSGNQTPQAYAAYLKTQITAKDAKAWQAGSPLAWAGESAVLAHDVVYKLDVASLPTCNAENKAAPIPLPANYDTVAQGVAKTQLEKAGVRLAFVLNAAFQ